MTWDAKQCYDCGAVRTFRWMGDMHTCKPVTNHAEYAVTIETVLNWLGSQDDSYRC